MNNGYGQQIVSTKANTLYALSKVIKKSKIEKMKRRQYMVEEWTSRLPSKYLYENYEQQ